MTDVKHGCVSPRRFYHELSKVYSNFTTGTLSKPPVSLHGQLMWREYNNLMGYTTPNFDKMVDNPVARQIPWDDDPMLLQAWKDGRTGYPFIDAIMIQLKETGWVHHLARHAVACFLTRGDLWQSWEEGAAIFEEELIDADWSLNNFNWQVCMFLRLEYFRNTHMFVSATSFNTVSTIVVVLYRSLLSILSLLQPSSVWKKDRQTWGLHSKMVTATEEYAR